MGDAASRLVRAYRWLARGFPEEFQRAHGNELVELSGDLIRHVAERQGWTGLLPFAVRIFGDLIMRLLIELGAELAQNVKFSLRTLRKSPGFAAVSILSLGMGIGMATSVYSQLESTIFRAVPEVREPQGLVRFQRPASYPDYEDYRDHSGQFAQLTAYLAPVPFVVNTGAFGVNPFDPFPYGLLTLIVSLESIFLSTFLLISQNRMSEQAERRADLDLHINLLAEHELTRILQILDAIQTKLGVEHDADTELAVLEMDTRPEDVLGEIERLQQLALNRQH